MTIDAHEEPLEAPSVVFDRVTAQGRLPFQNCNECAGVFHPPRVLCPHCGSPNVRWSVAAGNGSVYSMTTISPRDQAPYVVAIIDVAEGFRVMAEVVPATAAAIGTAVRVDADRTTAGTVIFAVCDEQEQV